MKIVTLMDYDEDQRVLMCKMWLYLVRRFHPDAEIVVIHHDRLEKIKPFAERAGAKLVRTDLSGIPPAAEWTRNSPAAACSWMDLTISVWKVYERLNLGRFLFIEPDAFVLGKLDDLWTLSEGMPFVGVAERERWGEIAPYLNLGVYAYDTGTRFITYEKLFRYWRMSGNRVPYPLGDQGLINGYCKSVGYKPFHPDIGIAWNCLAANCRVVRADDEDIEVRSGPLPKKSDEAGYGFIEYIGWDKDVRARILHFFGPTWKPWMLPTAQTLWSYLDRKVSGIEAGAGMERRMRCTIGDPPSNPNWNVDIGD